MIRIEIKMNGLFVVKCLRMCFYFTDWVVFDMKDLILVNNGFGVSMYIFQG